MAKSILLEYLNRGDFCELSEDSMNLENSELTNDHKSAFYQFSINDKKDLFSFIGPVSLNLSINTEEPGQYWWSTGDDYDPTSIEKIPNIDGYKELVDALHSVKYLGKVVPMGRICQ